MGGISDSCPFCNYRSKEPIEWRENKEEEGSISLKEELCCESIFYAELKARNKER